MNNVNDAKTSEKEIKGTLSFKCQRCILFILKISVIVEVVTLLVLVVHWRNVREISLAPRQLKVCYPRHELVISDVRNTTCGNRLTFKKDPKNTTYCCGNMSDVLILVLEKIASERYDSDINPEMIFFDLTNFGCASSKHVVSTLRLTSAPEKSLVPVGIHYKMSLKIDSSSVANSGLRYLETEDMVLIEATAFFYIFSQLKIKIGNTFDNNIVHCVQLLSSNGTTSVLLEELTSPCKMASEESSEKTSTIGATFWLTEGDRVYVTTSHPQEIINHLSIFKL
ncbi:uncharacterized protein LOC132749620 [Ruditapes philippinarum]|uniref:uncharacterized protein LOC132749620 n=1 Tax=Ruditapes philippinarum TaxID=129788 RepID=UPI00295C36A0|nr:uncharacterized protein LOC132749620 [Ruditapes philippinarum]